MLKNKIAILIGATLLQCNLEAAADSPSPQRTIPKAPKVMLEFSAHSSHPHEEWRKVLRKKRADAFWHKQGKANPYGDYLDQTTASSALLHAAAKNDFDRVKDTIAHGASINIVSGTMPENFKSPADFAAINNNIPCLEYILRTYREHIYDNPDCASNRCEYIPTRALKYAIRNGSIEAVRTIVTIVPEVFTEKCIIDALNVIRELQTPFPFTLQKIISQEVLDAMTVLLKEKLDSAS